VYFSPHKFLGGPGAPGVLIFNKQLYKNQVPDRPGGGTVLWTNPWGGKHYYPDIETREDGGTPPFLGTIRAALAIKLKEQIGLEQIARREKQLCDMFFAGLEGISGLRILADNYSDRLAVFALTIDGLHYNLIARLLNDRYGIQVRGGCACAGTYGHRLFHIEKEYSKKITDQIDTGDLSNKPGFVRVSLHPAMSDATVEFIISALKEIARRGHNMAKDYTYDPRTNEFTHKKSQPLVLDIESAFSLPAVS
jgi:selenocysteine lyase/cysteine desulfurase